MYMLARSRGRSPRREMNQKPGSISVATFELAFFFQSQRSSSRPLNFPVNSLRCFLPHRRVFLFSLSLTMAPSFTQRVRRLLRVLATRLRETHPPNSFLYETEPPASSELKATKMLRANTSDKALVLASVPLVQPLSPRTSASDLC